MQERLQTEGRLAEVELKLKETRLRLENLRDSLRRELDQFEPLENLKGDTITMLALDFATAQADYLQLLAIKKALARALGKD
jgi:hypothetical protein